MLKKLKIFIFAPFFLTIFETGCIKGPSNKEVELEHSQDSSQLVNDNSSNSPLPGPEALSKESATLKTAHGNILIKFYPKHAPNTVKRIEQLISQGFYDGLSFHRKEPGFVIQGGDPLGNGTGGSGKKLKAEFNNLKHVPTMIGMARGPDIHSADSQFYIMLGTATHLDHNYTIFAKVVEGFEIVQKLKVGDKILSFTMSK